MVICRQRPSTAAGVVFMTLEDETGFVNLVCWKDLFERHRVLAKTSPFIGVTGTVQNKDGVTHLVATELWKPDFRITPRGTRSRDFK
jgi:error-prone DNA polymerase